MNFDALSLTVSLYTLSYLLTDLTFSALLLLFFFVCLLLLRLVRSGLFILYLHVIINQLI